MEIVLYPDPALRRGAAEITDPGPEWVETARTMLELMYRFEGVGLAAPQVGLPVSLLVLNPSGKAEEAEEEKILLNPRVVARKGREWGQEGCLSFPGIYGEVQRATQIRLEAQNPEGRPISLAAEDFLARVILHEMDHLKGVLFIDRMTPAERIRIKAQLEDLERRYRDAHAAG